MHFILTRYYGSANITKSTFQVFASQDESQKPLLECEAREISFKDYSDSFPGASHYCLPTGTFALKLRPTVFSPFTPYLTHCPAHRGDSIGWRADVQKQARAILLGASDGGLQPLRRLIRQKATYDALVQIMEKTLISGEAITLTVRNDIQQMQLSEQLLKHAQDTFDEQQY